MSSEENSQSSLAQADAQAVLDITAFVEEKLPKAYATSPEYQCAVESLGSGTYKVILHLDMNADGSNFSDETLEDATAVTELESYYLVEDCLTEGLPYPLDFELHHLINGTELATVVKSSASDIYSRTIAGETDTF